VDPGREPGWKLSLVQGQFNSATPPLEAGQTYGQAFTAQGSFDKVGAFLPTYNSLTSSATLTLYSGEPGATLTPIASKRFTNIANNSWNYLTFPAVPAAKYYLELSDPAGTPAWWYQNGALTNGIDLGGPAYANRVVQPNWTMTLQVYATRP
jgi:hypothetical protein